MLITASGVDKARIGANQVVRIRLDGSLLPMWLSGGRSVDECDGPDGSVGDTQLRPSSEWKMHLACYAARPDVHGVVHAHPPAATGFALAGVPIPRDALAEIPVVIGPVALVPYGRPGTPALAEALLPYLASHEVFFLMNHGVTAMGRSLTEALLRMESVEQAARIVAVARLLGGEHRLPAREVAALAMQHPLHEFHNKSSSRSL